MGEVGEVVVSENKNVEQKMPKPKKERAKKIKKVKDLSEKLLERGWKKINEKVEALQPNLKPPLYNKSWYFGPYKIEAFRDLKTGEGVWIFKREKKKVTA